MDKFIKALVGSAVIFGAFNTLADETLLEGADNPPTLDASEKELAQKIEASQAKKKLLAQKVAELERLLLLQVKENEKLDKIIADLRG